jgi:hypothetical protein
MSDWREAAGRGLSLLEDDSSDAGVRTKRILRHVLDEGHSDGYISKDFFNVQQTAGGLPDGVSMDFFLSKVTGHVRDDLGSSSFNPDEVSDADVRTALMSFDTNIRRHISFLNGVVHQAAPGEVHRSLWELILASRGDSNSIYSCYADFLVDG